MAVRDSSLLSVFLSTDLSGVSASAILFSCLFFMKRCSVFKAVLFLSLLYRGQTK